MNPCQSVNETFFLCSPPDGSTGAHRTRVQNSGSISKERREHLVFVRKTSVICIVALMLLSFSMGSTLGVKHDLILPLGSQIFEHLRESLYRDALESWTPARSEKNGNKAVSNGNA